MVRVLFVCLGNICRSPMAEFIFKDLVKKKDLSSYISASSVATSFETRGEDMHIEAKAKLDEKNIPYTKRRARRLSKSDYKQYDYIIGMDESNINNIMRIIEDDPDKKVYKLLDFTNNTRDIADPWYTGNFTVAFNNILEGCKALLDSIIKKYEIDTGEEKLSTSEILKKIDNNIYNFTKITPNKFQVSEYLALASRILDIDMNISAFENSEMTDEEMLPSLEEYNKEINEYLFRFKK